MDAKQQQYMDFLDLAGPLRGFVEDNDELLQAQGFKREIKPAKSGPVVSYVRTVDKKKRTLCNYVFRKKGMYMRLYADFVNDYLPFLETLPDSMQKEMAKAGDCRRLLNPMDCSPHCLMGMDYTLGSEQRKKCRYGAFLFFVGPDEKAPLRAFLENELAARAEKSA